ncbi:MAG: hypothetical protein Q8Q21_00075, partial [bacterium]|nr:hypothetical protein [bacterium]
MNFERKNKKRFSLSFLVLFLIFSLVTFSPALAAESSTEKTSFVTYALASVGSFFKSIIFSNKTNEDSNKKQPTPTYTYSKQEMEKLIKDETENIKKSVAVLGGEVSNLKQEVTNLDRTQTVINQPVIERVVTQVAPASSQPSEGKVPKPEQARFGASIYTYDANIITPDQLEEKLNNLNTSLLNRISQSEAQANTQTTAVYRAVSLTNKIDNLSNITVSGVTGLTDSDIPNDITASNYLPLSGGTMTGTLNTTNILANASAYLNFGTTEGSDGYGIRDNSGTMQVKNSA